MRAGHVSTEQDREPMMKRGAACDLLHRIRVKDPGGNGCEFLCCDSRQCLFKVESAGRLFCILERPGENGE
jgi:hypothetical protein